MPDLTTTQIIIIASLLIASAISYIIINKKSMKEQHIHIHVHNELEVKIFETVSIINTKLDQIMTRQEKLDQAIADLNAGTNEIAADLQKLKDELAAGTVSDESLQALTDNIAILQQLGTQQ